MKTYEIVGLRSKEQADRIHDRLIEALGNKSKVELDTRQCPIKLANEVDPYVLSLISSFELVSFINIKNMKKLTKKEICSFFFS